jgi:hypothetical protein
VGERRWIEQAPEQAALTSVKAWSAQLAYTLGVQQVRCAMATIHRLEKLFRRTGDLDLDKSDLGRLENFVRRKIEDLVVRGEANAKANNRDVIQPWDLPITKGLQETMHRFRQINAELQLSEYLGGLAGLPPSDLAIGDETQARFSEIAGGLCLALAETFRIIDQKLKNPTTREWEQAYRLFDLLL